MSEDDPGGGPAADGGVPADAGSEGEDGGTDAYSGVLGVFPYALRNSDSRLFKLYAVLGGLVGLFVLVQFAISLAVVVSNTLGTPGGTFTFARTFIIVVGFLVLVPTIAPVVLFARRHRLSGGTLDPRYDLAMAVAGFVFLGALYVGLVASMPECFRFGEKLTCRPPPSGLTAPIVRLLYGLPPVAGLVPPAAAGVGIYLLDRVLR